MKRIIFFILPILIILTSCSNSRIIDGEYFNNCFLNSWYNNSNLVRTGDKLYYNFNPLNDFLRYGLYRISEEGTEKIYSEGLNNFPYQHVFKLQNNKEDLLLGIPGNKSEYGSGVEEITDNYLLKFDTDSKSFVLFDSFALPKGESILNYYSFDDIIYLVTEKHVYSYADGKYKKLVDTNKVIFLDEQPYSDDDFGIYFEDKYIYYFSKPDGFFVKQDPRTGKTEKLFESELLNKTEGVNGLDDIDFYYYIVNGCFVFSVQDTYYYKLDIGTKKISRLCEGYPGYTPCNACGKLFFIASDKGGLKSVNIETGEIKELSDRKIDELYIVDKKYVYCKTVDDRLFRVTQDGKVTERVNG